MNEGRGQDVAIVPFYEAELKFSLLCTCACCSKQDVPGCSSASGASGHLWTWAKPSSPPRHSGLIHVIFWGQCGMSPAGCLPSCEGFLGAWCGLARHTRCSQLSGMDAQGHAMGIALGACNGPRTFHGQGRFGSMSCPKGIFWLTWGQWPLHCAWWTSSTEWAP